MSTACGANPELTDRIRVRWSPALDADLEAAVVVGDGTYAQGGASGEWHRVEPAGDHHEPTGESFATLVDLFIGTAGELSAADRAVVASLRLPTAADVAECVGPRVAQSIRVDVIRDLIFALNPDAEDWALWDAARQVA